MSFFRREPEDPAPNPGHRPLSERPGSAGPQGATARERPVTRIADGTRVTGEISGSTELLVEGELDGRIRLEGRVVVGKGGTVRGQIDARSVLVAGTVEGDVRGSERVEVGGSGKLQGDIAAPRVTIAEGAFFKGKIEMGAGSAGRRSEPAPAPGRPRPQGGERSPGLFPEESGGGERPGGGAQ